MAKVFVRPVAAAYTYTGHLQAIDSVEVRPRVSGYITQVDFSGGEMVHKGQPLFRIDPRSYQDQVDNLHASLAAARATLTLARTNAARGNKLIAKNYISRAQLDTLNSAERNAAAEVAATRAQLANAELNLGFTEVRAPIAGRVSNVQITAGNLVTSSDVLTTVVSVKPLYAYFDVNEATYLQLLAHGHANAYGKGTATHAPVLMGLSDNSSFPYSGHVDFIDNQVSTDSGTIRMRAVFDNHDGDLVPGLFVRLRLAVGSPRPTVLVAPRAIGTNLSDRFVYVVGTDGKATYQKVEVGPLFHGLRVVRAGLKPGDRVVIDGMQRVRPGQRVQAKLVSMGIHLSQHQRALVRRGGPLGGSGAQTTVADR